MGEQLVIKGVRRFLRQRDGMGGKHARLLFDACRCAGMMGVERMTEVALPDGEHAEQAGEDEHRSKQDEDHRSPICDKLAPHGDFLARRMHKLDRLPYAVHARLPPFANRESGFNLWESEPPDKQMLGHHSAIAWLVTGIHAAGLSDSLLELLVAIGDEPVESRAAFVS